MYLKMDADQSGDAHPTSPNSHKVEPQEQTMDAAVANGSSTPQSVLDLAQGFSQQNCTAAHSAVLNVNNGSRSLLEPRPKHEEEIEATGRHTSIQDMKLPSLDHRVNEQEYKTEPRADSETQEDLKDPEIGTQHSLALQDYNKHQQALQVQEDASSIVNTLQDEVDMEDMALLTAPPSVSESDGPRIEAFAKLEFDDGEFYMNTYAAELGRDLRAARLVSGREQEGSTLSEPKWMRPKTSSDEVSQRSKSKRGEKRHMASSVVSESGGIMGIDAQEPEPRRKSRGKRSKSTTSSSQQLSRKSSMVLQNGRTDYQSLAMASLMDSGATYCAGSLMPARDACPLIPIHPPAVAEGVSAGPMSISRKHVRIAFNFEKHLFEITILGRNGAFVDDTHYAEGKVLPLKNGSLIQIGGVGVRFVLPEVALGDTGAETTISSSLLSGGKMSFEFEDGRGESNIMIDSSDIQSSKDDGDSSDGDDEADEEADEEVENGVQPEASSEEDEQDAQDNNEDVLEEPKKGTRPRRVKTKGRGKSKAKAKVEAAAKAKPKAKSKTKPKLPPKPEPVPDPAAPIVKRRGPGRPPKNGVSSKREQALMARQAREAAKAEALKNGAEMWKGKDGKPQKEAQEGDGTAEPVVAKRKYTKRKSKDVQTGEENAARASTDQTDSVPPEQILSLPPRPPKEKKPTKPPRSPSPVYDESQMTPEQLAKPQSSYVVLIHEALTNSKTGAMSLPQIYRAIERRYPFYKLRVQTTGWQSSVRHNLSQHAAFRKIERDGKGWMWGLVPEVSIEKEKKRRPTPPPVPPQQFYQQDPHMMPNPYMYTGMPPPNGQVPLHIAYGSYGMPHSHIPRAPSNQPPIEPISLPLPLPHAHINESSTYQSPYQSAPPPPPPQQPLQNGQQQPQQQPQSQPQQQPPEQPSSSHPNGHTESNPSSLNQPPSSLPAYQNSQQPGLAASPAFFPPSQRKPPLNYPQNAPTLSPSASPNNTSQDVFQAVSKFKKVFINSMGDRARGELLVTSAINRTLGGQPSSSVPGNEEDPQERAVMQALSDMLENLSKKTSEARRQASQTPSQQLSSPIPTRSPHSFPSPQEASRVQSQQQQQQQQYQDHDRRPNGQQPTPPQSLQDQPPALAPHQRMPPLHIEAVTSSIETNSKTAPRESHPADSNLPPPDPNSGVGSPQSMHGTKRALETDTQDTIDAGQPQTKKVAIG